MKEPKDLIVVSDVSVRRGGNVVLDHVSFKIQKKDIVAILGPNGAGKTTLVRAMLGLEPAKGTIALFGQPLLQFTDWKRIGYVPQRIAIERLFPGTVQEILSMRFPVKKQFIEHLGLVPLLKRKFIGLSGGQQQRVLLGFALSGSPDLLIFDEPTVGVDLASQQSFYRLIKHLNEKHDLTIIIVTHDVAMVPAACTKAICINHSVCCETSAKEAPKVLSKIYGPTFVRHHHHD